MLFVQTEYTATAWLHTKATIAWDVVRSVAVLPDHSRYHIDISDVMSGEQIPICSSVSTMQ